MKPITLGLVACLAALGALCLSLVRAGPVTEPPAPERPYGIAMRVPWTTSRISGSPEPPAPYRIERVFPKLTFKNPLLLTNAPGTAPPLVSCTTPEMDEAASDRMSAAITFNLQLEHSRARARSNEKPSSYGLCP